LARVYKTGAIIARFSRRSSAGAGSNGGLRWAPPVFNRFRGCASFFSINRARNFLEAHQPATAIR
jgi:hypothetical protein